MSDNLETDNPNDDTKEHYRSHLNRPACDECAAMQKRLAILSAGVGAAFGMAAVYFLVKRRG